MPADIGFGVASHRPKRIVRGIFGHGFPGFGIACEDQCEFACEWKNGVRPRFSSLNRTSDLTPIPWVEARDIAQAIVHLESAGFVMGEILHVDGGQSAGH